MNLSFTLDNDPLGNFFHEGSQAATGYLPHVNVFAQDNLTETPHVLRVDVGVGSVFLFDYMIYTRTGQAETNGTTPSSPLAQNSPSATIDECVSIPFYHREIIPFFRSMTTFFVSNILRD